MLISTMNAQKPKVPRAVNLFVRPMKEKSLLEIDLKDTKDYAEWISIAHDLNHVIDATKKLYDFLDKGEKDSTIIRSLWTSALVTYIRCFTSGKRRSKLSSNIFANLNGDPIGTHQYYKDTRDKHIAHPVNIFEEMKIGIIPSDSFPKSPSYIGLGHLYAFRLTDEKEGVAQLGRLAYIALGYTNNQIKETEVKVLNEIDILSEKELMDLRSLKIQPQGGGDAANKKRT